MEAGNFGQNAFFYDAAEGLLTATILLVAEFCEPKERHIVSVFKIIQELLAPSKNPGRNGKKNQFQELMDLCPWFWTTQNGKNGIYVRGRNGNSIFIPAAGVHTGADLKSAGASGLYWLSSFNESRPSNGCEFYFNSNGVSTNYYDYRFNGSSIRPVRRK